jgi:hypothetical protein
VKRNVGEAWGKEIERLLRVEILPKLGDKQIGMIKKADILDLLDAIVDRGSPITANRAFAVLRQLFNWATDRSSTESTLSCPCWSFPVRKQIARKLPSRQCATNDVSLSAVPCCVFGV